jgi:transposase
MLDVAGKELQTQAMDHHGLVAGVCKDIKVAALINARLPSDPQRKVSPGKSVVSMLLNGLGFTNRRLYLTPQFFANKPVERLLDAPISAEDLTDYLRERFTWNINHRPLVMSLRSRYEDLKEMRDQKKEQSRG